MEYFYYDQLGQKYYSKFDALRSKNEISLYFYDKEFLEFDWKIEPKETLSELYKLRAQQLRDKYEYLILAYSGGIDSTNMLEAFYYNNIHIDEIIMVGAFSQDSYYGSDENHNGEIYHNCIPTLQMMNLKNTKITYHDYSKLFDTPEKFVSYNDIDKKYIVVDTHFSIHYRWWETSSLLNFDNNKKKKSIIFGIDKPNFSINDYKPNFSINDSKHFLSFNALAVSDYGNYPLCKEYNDINREFFYWTPDMPKILSKQLHFLSFNAFAVSDYGNYPLCKEYNDINREFFYWTPDMPKILSKQLHLLSNFYNENVLSKKIITNDIFFSSKYYHEIIKKIIYNNVKNSLRFKSQKSNNILSLRDSFIMKNKNSKIYEDYVKQVVWAHKNFSELLMKHGSYNRNDIWSRKYFIN